MRKEIDFTKRYWGITSPLFEPRIYELIPQMWTESHHAGRIDYEYKFLIVGKPEYEVSSFVTLQSYAFFETYDEVLDAYMWLNEKPGRALFNYGMEVVKAE